MHARRLRRVGLALCAASTAHAADPAPQAAQQARLFLLRHAGLTATSDVAALDLYRDDARISVSAWQGGQEIERGIAQGKAWKAQLRAGWFDGTTRLEASSFQEAGVTAHGQRLVIRAKRYSQTRCYWDNGYAVAIEPDERGQYRIVEERLTFLRDATCRTMAAGVAAAPATPTAPMSQAWPAVLPAGTARIAAARAGSLPPNVVPSGEGPPRLPPAMSAASVQAQAPGASPAGIATAATTHPTRAERKEGP